MLTNKAEIQQDKQRSDGTYRRIQTDKMQFFCVVGISLKYFYGCFLWWFQTKKRLFLCDEHCFPSFCPAKSGAFCGKAGRFSTESAGVFLQKSACFSAKMPTINPLHKASEEVLAFASAWKPLRNAEKTVGLVMGKAVSVSFWKPFPDIGVYIQMWRCGGLKLAKCDYRQVRSATPPPPSSVLGA